jgi:tetratricopeptide (TPR) repeat protein
LAVEKNPSDSEALHGLAAIAHAQRDLAGAKASYRRVLAINPSYLPSLIGLADVDWDSGDRSAALKAYKDIIDRFPPGTYPARIQTRLDGAAGGGDKPAPAPAPAPAPEPAGGG